MRIVIENLEVHVHEAPANSGRRRHFSSPAIDPEKEHALRKQELEEWGATRAAIELRELAEKLPTEPGHIIDPEVRPEDRERFLLNHVARALLDRADELHPLFRDYSERAEAAAAAGVNTTGPPTAAEFTAAPATAAPIAGDRCQACLGSGGTDAGTCPVCKGTGKESKSPAPAAS